MPNWCQNGAKFTHEDPQQITRIEKAYKEDKLFTEFVPCPQELLVQEEVGDNFNERVKAREAANREKYGYSDWYEWSVNNWGTKWDISSDDSEASSQDANSIMLSFNTAWSPPIGFYEKMTELGFDITAFYLEEGMGFCGKWTSELGDDDYNFDGSEDLDDIPDDIRTYWDLDTICDWRDQEDEEESEEETAEDKQ
jgi:Ferredoxin-like domain in Api92-like protein